MRLFAVRFQPFFTKLTVIKFTLIATSHHVRRSVCLKAQTVRWCLPRLHNLVSLHPGFSSPIPIGTFWAHTFFSADFAAGQTPRAPPCICHSGQRLIHVLLMVCAQWLGELGILKVTQRLARIGFGRKASLAQILTQNITLCIEFALAQADFFSPQDEVLLRDACFQPRRCFRRTNGQRHDTSIQ